MKRLLILATIRNGNKEKLTSYLKDKLKRHCDIDLELFSDLVIEIEREKVNVTVAGRNIRDYDLIYIRKANPGVAKALAICLDFFHKRYFDSAWSKSGFVGDKLAAITKLAVCGLPVIPTFYCHRDNFNKNIDRFVEKVGFPIIAKELRSQRLEGIYLLKNKKDVYKLPGTKKNGQNTSFLFQKFIDFDREYRLVVLGNRVAVVHTKVKRNFNKLKVIHEDPNAQPVFLNPNKLHSKIRQIAVKSAKVLGLEIAGVDACFERKTGKIFLIEVNRGPGFDYDDRISPELPALAKFIEKELFRSTV